MEARFRGENIFFAESSYIFKTKEVKLV